VTPGARGEGRPPRTRAWVAAGAAVVAAGLLVAWFVWRPDPPKPPKPEPFTNSVGMAFVPVPDGEFLMGAHAQDKDRLPVEQPQHRVRITRPFFLGVREVTQQQYRAVMQANPSAHSTAGAEKTKVKGLKTDHLPVENVTWDDARRFCERLTALPAEQGHRRTYRLPLEAEWEYACRAGGAPERRFNFPETDFFGSANLVDNTRPGPARMRGRPVEVASFRPNAWGLHDMHGNVREWCADWYDPAYYRQAATAGGAARDPRGPRASPSGTRVVRGGSFSDAPSVARTTARAGQLPNDGAGNIGFRVACDVRP
jgi:formylglycine-generating enzyme required for sulfatase activity